MEIRSICVFGAGAVGGHFAAKLAAAGHAVSAVARGANLETIRAGGFALREGERTFAGRLRASDRAADLGAQDVVFVTTKATALEALADAAPALSHRDTMFVFVQNGIPWWYAQGLDGGTHRGRPRPPELSRLDPGGALARALAPERVIGAVVYSSNDLVAPGTVLNHSIGRNMLVVGEPDDRQTPRIGALRALLEGAGLHSPAAPDIRAAVWDKLLINFGSTLCVPIGEPIAALIEDPRLRAARERLFAEGRAIARAHGVEPDAAPRRPGGGQQSSGSMQHKPSMLQDYELGRPMEIEAILAMPCAFARTARVEAPALESLTAVTARLAARKGLYFAFVSEILNRLKQAELERERVIAERRRLESEADAGLAERERDEARRRAQRAAADDIADPPAPAPARAPTPQQRSRVAAGVAIGVAVGIAFFIGTRMPRPPAAPSIQPPAPAPAPRALEPQPPSHPVPVLFRLDGDVDAFAARLKEKE